MLGKSQIKYIQSLGHKKHRDEEKLFIAEGPKLAEELLSSAPAQVQHVYATSEWLDVNSSLVQSAIVVTEEELAKISQLQTPNQVLIVARYFNTAEPPDTSGEIILALDGIRDPGNLGTIIRIADWFDVRHIVCSGDCADFYNPKVIQSTMGSIARVSVAYTELAEWLRRMQGKVPVFAAALNGSELKRTGSVSSGILVIGNESKGISEEIMAMADQRITIIRKGRAESLNAAVAAGIILSHITG